MLRSKCQCERQIRQDMPLVLAVEAQIIKSNPFRLVCGEDLCQLREVCSRRDRIYAALIKSIKRLRSQSARYVALIEKGCPIDPLEVGTDCQTVLLLNLHCVFGDLVLGSRPARSERVPAVGSRQARK